MKRIIILLSLVVGFAFNGNAQVNYTFKDGMLRVDAITLNTIESWLKDTESGATSATIYAYMEQRLGAIATNDFRLHYNAAKAEQAAATPNNSTMRITESCGCVTFSLNESAVLEPSTLQPSSGSNSWNDYNVERLGAAHRNYGYVHKDQDKSYDKSISGGSNQSASWSELFYVMLCTTASGLPSPQCGCNKQLNVCAHGDARLHTNTTQGGKGVSTRNNIARAEGAMVVLDMDDDGVFQVLGATQGKRESVFNQTANPAFFVNAIQLGVNAGIAIAAGAITPAQITALTNQLTSLIGTPVYNTTGNLGAGETIIAVDACRISTLRPNVPKHIRIVTDSYIYVKGRHRNTGSHQSIAYVATDYRLSGVLIGGAPNTTCCVKNNIGSWAVGSATWAITDENSLRGSVTQILNAYAPWQAGLPVTSNIGTIYGKTNYCPRTLGGTGGNLPISACTASTLPISLIALNPTPMPLNTNQPYNPSDWSIIGNTTAIGFNPVQGTFTPSGNAPGVYTFRYTNPITGVVSTTAPLTLYAPPQISLTSVNPINCNSTATILRATATNSGDEVVTWAYSPSSSTTPSIYSDSTVTNAGTYYVTATTEAGCTATTSAVVAAADMTPPTINASASVANTTVINTESQLLPNGAGYAWSSTTPNAAPAQSGTYTVTATGANGCTATQSVSVVFNAQPVIVVTQKAANLWTLQAVIPDSMATFVWNTGQTTDSINVVNYGTYTVTVSSTYGVSTATTTITAPPGNVVIGTATTVNTSIGYPAPIQDYYKTSKQYILLKATELNGQGIGGIGNFTRIGFNITALNGVGLMENYTISMKNTTATALTTTPDNAGFTQVYNPTNLTISNTGIYYFNFTTPFTWDGTSNVLIQICEGATIGSFTNNASTTYSAAGFNAYAHYKSDITAACPTTTGSIVSTNRPNTYLMFTPLSTPFCAPTINLAITSVTANSAFVSFDMANPTGFSTNVEYEVRTIGAPGTGAVGLVGSGIVATTASGMSNGFALSGLNPTTTYTVYTRNNCSNNSYSNWATTSFTTPATPCSGSPVIGNINVVTTGSTTTLSPQIANTYAGITYQWQVATSATGGTWTNIAGATNPSYSPTPNASQLYYILVATCVNSGLSTTSPVVTVAATPFSQLYCSSVATQTADEDILEVSFNGASNTSTCTTTGTGSSSILNRYSDYTTLSGTAPNYVYPGSFTAQQGSNAPFSVQIGTCNTGSYNNGVAIWIDFNQNGVFDTYEKVYNSAVLTSGPHIESGTIAIPAIAATGLTRMRVINSESSPINPCGTYGYGETEDYLVNITPPCNTINSSSITACVSYTWFVNGITYTTSGTYSSVTVDAAGCTHTETLYLTIQPHTVTNLSNDGPITCAFPAVTLIANSNTGDTYSYSSGSATVTVAGVYTVTATSVNGCTATATTIVTGNSIAPTASLTENGPITCTLQTVTLDASASTGAGATYAFSAGTNTSAAATAFVTSAGTYTVTVSSNGCTSTASATVTGSPVLTQTTNIVFCDSYTWPVNGQVYTASGTYTATSTNASGCSINEILNLTIDHSTTNTTNINICNSYTWSVDGMTYTTSGVYYHFGTNASGCYHTEILNLTIETPPYIAIIANGNSGNPINGTSVCLDPMATYCATGGNSYQWSMGGTAACVSGVTIPAEYTVVAYSGTGCSSLVSFTVVAPPAPVSITVIPDIDNQTFIVSGSDFTNPNYTNSFSINGITATPTSLSATTAVFNAPLGYCDSTYTINFTQTPITTTANACYTVNSTTTIANFWRRHFYYSQACGKVTVTHISRRPLGTSFYWTMRPCNAATPAYSGTSTTGQPICPTAFAPGCYILCISLPNSPSACSDYCRQITINPPPTATITGNSAVCNNSTTQICASMTGGTAPYTYIWSYIPTSGLGIGLATTASCVAASAGIYTVTITDANGCTATASKTITVLSAPNVTISATSNVK